MEIHTEIATLVRKHENGFINQLLLSLPTSYTRITSAHSNNYERIVAALRKLCHEGRDNDEADDFFKEISVDKKQWAKLQTGDQKFTSIVKALQKSVEQSSRKVNSQLEGYLSSSKKSGRCVPLESKVKDNFEWLKLKNKYPMCEPKLKAKLVQAISDSNNEANIRTRMQDPEHHPKVTLLDDSLLVDQYERMKIDYRWTDEDQRLFLTNIAKLKHKFNSTEFLKRCGRFRFISQHELQTLAAEQISRRLDQDNKIYLSREFLLDKYFSSKDCLTEPEMRFILKTSPMLSKCVDKTFIRNALKHIDYADINKLELEIAEDIIARFDQVRRAVRDSRKLYKQTNNNAIKQRILEFERRQQFQVAREIAREQLKRQKMRRPNHTQSARKFKPFHFQTKKSFLPLNPYHPPSGLFVKDCNEQCNDDLFNHYEANYIEREKTPQVQQKIPTNSISMLQFYTGGLETKTPEIPFDAISIICQVIKTQFYEKAIREALENYEPAIPDPIKTTQRSVLNKQGSYMDLEKRPKTNAKIAQESSQAVIKRKLLQNKEKAKGVVYVNKLLILSAENSYTSFKALNTKFTPEQVNTKDGRGNTALYYAAKNQNMEFVNHLLNLGADPSINGEKDYTPLHFIFKTNNLNLITRCLCAPKTPNLNAVNKDNKTPLAYATHDVLSRLYLQDGVVVVQNRKVEFDNNLLLTQERLDRLGEGFSFEVAQYSRKKINL